MFLRASRRSLLIALVPCAVACGGGQNIQLTGSSGAGATTSGGAGGNASSSNAAPSSSTGLNSVGVGVGGGSSSSGAGAGPGTFVYVHDNTTLFSVDPKNPGAPPVQIGDFDCIGPNTGETSMTDFAVNQNGEMWAISSHTAHKIQVMGSTVHCATSTPLNSVKNISFYGLTFAPAGVLGKDEVLVAGNTDGQLFAIDGNGNLTQHGTFGTVPNDDGNGHPFMYPGTAWELSGDIVFMANNGNPIGFATVRDCANPPSTYKCNKTDTLIQIDMKNLANAGTQSVTLAVRGQVVKAGNCNDPNNTGYGGMYGIAAWNDKIYGFSHSGNIVSISNNNGSACLLQSSTNKWAGAGVTTVAPVEVPNPK